MKNQLSIDEQVVRTIFTKYCQAKLMLEKMNVVESGFVKEDSISYGGQNRIPPLIEDYQKHIKNVDSVLALLSKSEYGFIVKNFLVKAPKNWWKKNYTSKEYKNLQTKAVKRFLYLFLI